MTKQEVIEKFEEMLSKAEGKEINGIVFALDISETPTSGSTAISVHMDAPGIKRVIDHLNGKISERNRERNGIANGLMNALKAVIEDDCNCDKCQARRATGEPLVSVLSMQDFLEKIRKSEKDNSETINPTDSPKSLSDLAAEARAKGLTMDEFLDSLLQVK